MAENEPTQNPVQGEGHEDDATPRSGRKPNQSTR